MHKIEGLHHVTCLTQDIARNKWFYTTILGLHLLKKTVHHDDIFSYHLFYGDPRTFSSCISFVEQKTQDTTHQYPSTLGLWVPSTHSLHYWQHRLSHFGISCDPITFQFDVFGFTFKDPDGLTLRFIANTFTNIDDLPTHSSLVATEHAIKDIGEIYFHIHHSDQCEQWLTQILPFKYITQVDKAMLYTYSRSGTPLRCIVTYDCSTKALPIVGNIHHTAWRVADSATLSQLHAELTQLNYLTSDVIDRTSFQSVYVRDHHHLLFEFTTDVSEYPIEALHHAPDQSLSLPPALEPYRKVIEKRLKPL